METLTLRDAALLVKTARMAFFEHLGHKSTSNPNSSAVGIREKMGVYVRAELVDEQHDRSPLVLGFTGYALPHKDLHQSTRDASVAIAARNLSIPLHPHQVLFEVTILSPPERLTKQGRSQTPAVQLERDAVMVISGMRKAIILPQSASAECRNQEELFAECCMAAGLTADAWISTDVDLYRFETRIFRERRDGGVEEVTPS